MSTAALNILCVCSGNTCRSPMLETLLRAVLKKSLPSAIIASAGTSAGIGQPASAGAQTAMMRCGLSLKDHRSRAVSELNLATFDRVLCMTSAHAAYIRSRGVPAARIAVVNAEHGGVPDPFGGDDVEYEACARVLEHAAHAFASINDNQAKSS